MFKLILCVALLGYVSADEVTKATANLTVGTAHGTITFTKQGQAIKVTGKITGLKPGSHGFHVHEKGDLGDNCVKAGGHLNPYKKNHGAPTDDDRHVGDLGNIFADGNGEATIDITDSQLAFSGDANIIGKAIVVHADTDDLGKGGFDDSKTTGHAGARVACGLIHSGAAMFSAPLILFVVAISAALLNK